jgi:hypothetical protein
MGINWFDNAVGVEKIAISLLLSHGRTAPLQNTGSQLCRPGNMIGALAMKRLNIIPKQLCKLRLRF